jgi:hypothetical protein
MHPMRRCLPLAVAAALLGVAAEGARAAPVSEQDLRLATIQMDAGAFERGQTVEQLILCLRTWKPGDGRPANAIEIARLSDDIFTVAATLRSHAIFHFQVARERGAPVALLRRVEYQVPAHGAYQQVTDTETKRVMLRSACTKP